MLAIATDPAPELLLLDEPASGIDRNGLTLFYDKLLELKHQEDMSILMVSHDLSCLRRYADQALLLDGGAPAAQGPPDQVLASTAFTQIFGLGA
jgi:zinc transport system ATP-binding protein